MPVVSLSPAGKYGNWDVQAGVGCFVLNEHQQVLMVQERNGPLRGKGELPAWAAFTDMSSLQLLADSCIHIIIAIEVLQALSPHIKGHADQTRLMHGVAIVHLKVRMMTYTFTPALQSRMSCRGMEDGDGYGRSRGGHHCSS